MNFGLFLFLSGVIAIAYAVIVLFCVELMSVDDTTWLWRICCFIPFLNIFFALMKFGKFKKYWKGIIKSLKFWCKGIFSYKFSKIKISDEEIDEICGMY